MPATTREHRSAQELTVDFDALEHDGTSEVSPIFQRGDLPPPPKNLFAKEPRTGAYSSVDADARRNDHDNAPSPPETPSADRGGRPAQARPTAAFGTPPRQPSPSIFGDDLVGDKSLDEVILSYLADDLDPPRQK